MLDFFRRYFASRRDAQLAARLAEIQDVIVCSQAASIQRLYERAERLPD